MRYLYTGYLDFDVETLVEWNQAKMIGEKYEFEYWNNYVESIKDEFNWTSYK